LNQAAQPDLAAARVDGVSKQRNDERTGLHPLLTTKLQQVFISQWGQGLMGGSSGD
jgi:hypothetical protein